MNEVEMTSTHPERSENSQIAVAFTAGQLLRNAREAAGLHIGALAVSMKVPVKKLEALEADRADLLLDAVFVRALASSVCRTLKIDPMPVLELLPQTAKPNFDTGGKGINAPFKAPSKTGFGGVFEWIRRPVVTMVAILLLAALGVLLLPEIRLPNFVAKSEDIPSPVALVKDSPTEHAVPSDRIEEKLPPVEVVPGPSDIELKKLSIADTAVPANLLADEKSTDLLVIRAKGTTWVEVVDSTGAVLVRRTLQDGGIASATGVTPLAVVVGKADMVDVEVRGKAFSMSAISKDNVARFEVK